MSIKSILCSIFAVLLFWGLVVATIFMFGFHIILGIGGIVMTIAIPPILMRKAIRYSKGLLDSVIAKFIVPVLFLVGLAAALLIFFLG